MFYVYILEFDETPVKQIINGDLKHINQISCKMYMQCMSEVIKVDKASKELVKQNERVICIRYLIPFQILFYIYPIHNSNIYRQFL